MKLFFQFAKCALLLTAGALWTLPAVAQRPRFATSRPNPGFHSQAVREQKHPPREQARRNGGAQKPPVQRPRSEERRLPVAPTTQKPNVNPNRPPTNNNGGNPNRAPANNNGNPNRPNNNGGQTKPQRNFSDLSRDDQQRIRQNERKFNQLPPQRQQQMKDAAHTWQRMTPEQQNHIKNDVIPKWKQLPQDRRRAIQNRLGVLKNMPESARNQHLADPNFTRGMNEEDKATLQDLSHLHVGGAPDPPQE